MLRSVNVHEAKTHLSRLLEEVARGEEIILAKSGRPVARLIPVESSPRRRLGFVAGHLTDAFFAPLPEEELSEWD